MRYLPGPVDTQKKKPQNKHNVQDRKWIPRQSARAGCPGGAAPGKQKKGDVSLGTRAPCSLNIIVNTSFQRQIHTFIAMFTAMWRLLRCGIAPQWCNLCILEP